MLQHRLICTRWWAAVIAVSLCVSSSCRSVAPAAKTPESSVAHADRNVRDYIQKVQYEEIVEEAAEILVGDGFAAQVPNSQSPSPFTLQDIHDMEYWDLSLEQALQIALVNAKVLRNAGGTVIQASQPPPTVLDPAIQSVDPRFGVEAALSQFDAVYRNSISAQNLDRALNNSFFGGGTRTLQQDIFGAHQSLSKRTVTGAQFGVYHDMDYDASNAPGNRFPAAWTTSVVTEARQSIGRGRNTLANRIVGPYSQPGIYNGVLIAELNTDVELKKFEQAIRDLVGNVENAYWDLYLAYRTFDTKNQAYRASCEIYDKVTAQANSGRRGAAEALQARWQRDFFLNEVENSITGSRRDGTRTNNGSGGGALLTPSGLFQAERRLRLLLGLPSTDGRCLRPADEPTVAPIQFAWDESLTEAIMRRVELREERLHVRRYEMQLVAAKQNMLPMLDLVARHRNRGFGQLLFGDDPEEFHSAYQNLFDGDFQEWEFGLDFAVTIGRRAEHAALRQAKLHLARARFQYQAKQQDVENELQGAYQEMDATLRRIHRTDGIRQTAESEVNALEALYQTGQATLDQLLDAHRRWADSELMYQRAMVEYGLAIKDFHYQKGTLLDYAGVQLAH